MKLDFDIAIVGSGFGGALLGMIARRLGLSVLLLERDSHPRFAIGESTSPLTNLLIEQIARRYNLPALLPLTSYGPWQRTYPDIVCGLKRGFTFFAHQAVPARSQERSYHPALDRSSQLMVAASPNEETADTHWLRSDVDHFLVHCAVEAGVDYRDKTHVTALSRIGSDAWQLTGTQQGQPFTTSARLLIDAAGPRGLLSRMLGLPSSSFRDYPATQAVYSHFSGVRRSDTMETFAPDGCPPYAPDDAALHHVFDGGWMWVLRFKNGIASAGFAVTDPIAQELGLPCAAEAAWSRFLQRFPSIGEQFAEAQPVQPFVYAPGLSYRCSQAAGDGWAMLPSAAAVIDPLFSTGIPLTLLGIERLARLLETHWESPSLQGALCRYGETTLSEVDTTAEYIGACYQAMPVFPLFAALSMFYFAAASYSEMARRLEKPHLITRFLAADHTMFRAGLTRCREMLPYALANPTPQTIRAFETAVAESIACLNVAGLSDPAKQNRYGVDLEDVVQNAEKLEMTPEQMRQVLATAPWAAQASS